MGRSVLPQSPEILVVDDEAAIREAIAAALAGRFTVHCAATGHEAMSVLRAHHIAMIILDAVLENENGLDLVDRFRTVSSARILVLTGYGTETLMLQALRARVDDFVKKPVSLSALDAALERLLPSPRVSTDLAARARQHLEEHSAKPIRFADVADQLGVSLAHLRWLFRTTYGQTPTRYLAGLRMRRASLLLRTTSWGVEHIALEVGFPNVAWFNKQFRRVYDGTPSAFRAGQTRPGAPGNVQETDEGA